MPQAKERPAASIASSALSKTASHCGGLAVRLSNTSERCDCKSKFYPRNGMIYAALNTFPLMVCQSYHFLRQK
eukprot:scaffold141761_cov17-Prasinocladus_malaysianus.AAC.1